MRAHLFAPLLFLCCLIIAPPAHAQQEPDNQAQARAVEFYEAGLKAAFAGDYGEAIFEFKQGHQLAPNGLFTYNITIAYLKLDNFSDALRFARETANRARDLTPEQRAKNDARLHAISLRLTTTSLLSGAAEHSSLRPKRVAGFSFISAGGLLVGGTLLYTVNVRQRASSFSSDYGSRIEREEQGEFTREDCDDLRSRENSSAGASQAEKAECRAVLDRIQQANTLVPALGVTSLTLIGVGVTLLVLDRRDARVSISPVLSPGAQGLNVRVRF